MIVAARRGTLRWGAKSTLQRTIIGTDSRLAEIFRRLPDLATSDAPIVIEGESGTGKELLAHRIHELSHRAGRPMVALNCGAVPSTLLDSELFGYEKGAFTGAQTQRAGRIEQAATGTLFLDEISEMPAEMQVRLLRLLQEGEFTRVGGLQPVKVDVRVVAATNRNLEQMVTDQTFREDLYYRLSVFTIHLPPLRSRKADILLLAEHFLRTFVARHDKAIVGFTSEAAEYLQRYTYPGNVRELQNIIQRAIVLCQGVRVDAGDLPTRMRRNVEQAGDGRISIEIPRTAEELKLVKEEAKRRVSEQVERAFLRRVLTETRGNVSHAAKLSDMNRTQMHQMIRRCGLDPDHFRGYEGTNDSRIGIAMPEGLTAEGA